MGVTLGLKGGQRYNVPTLEEDHDSRWQLVACLVKGAVFRLEYVGSHVAPLLAFFFRSLVRVWR